MLKNDDWIRRMAAGGMLEPFEPDQITFFEGRRVLSYGVSSYGYDVRCSDEFRIFTPTWGSVVDPKCFDERSYVLYRGDECVIPPNSFALARSVEYVRVPRSVLVLVIGKSTYARCGIVCGCTPLEPEWEGHLTIELSNTTPLPARVYANEGIAQLLFLGAEAGCSRSYADRNGKYQGDRGVVPPKV